MNADDLFIVIDMQNVYAAGQPWACRDMDRTADRILRILNAPAAPECVFTRFIAADDPTGVWRDYNRENARINADAWCNEIIPALASAAREHPLYTKSAYSSLSLPELRERAERAGRAVVAGVVAECCVLSTVLALIDAGVYVIYLTDAVSGTTRQTEEAVITVLSGLAPLHLTLMTTEEYLNETNASH